MVDDPFCGRCGGNCSCTEVGECRNADTRANLNWQHVVDADWTRYEDEIIRTYDPATPYIDRMRRS